MKDPKEKQEENEEKQQQNGLKNPAAHPVPQSGSEEELDETMISNIGRSAEADEAEGDESLASDGPVSQEEGDDGADLNNNNGN